MTNDEIRATFFPSWGFSTGNLGMPRVFSHRPIGLHIRFMECRRCHNVMVREVFADRQYDAGPGAFIGWRCIICGAILDPLILKHQAAHPKPIAKRARLRTGGVPIQSTSAER